MRLTLFQKGIILVLAPLVVQIGLVLSLSSLYAQSEADARRAIRARELNESITEAMHRCVEMLKQAFISVDEGTGGRVGQPVSADAAVEALTSLRQRCADDRKDAEDVNAIIDSVKHISEVVNTANASQSGNNIDHTLRKTSFKNLRKYGHVLERLALMSKENKELLDGTPERQSELRRRANNFVVAATIADVLCCLALIGFFSRSIVRRLIVMMDNTFRLAADRPLNLPVSGNDEIAQVDKSFHAMAKSLKQAQRLRDEVVQMVSHDLRSPLTSIQGVVQMLQAGNFGEPKPEEKRMLLIAESNANRMLTLINDLLDIEKIEGGQLPLNKSVFDITTVFDKSKQSVVTMLDGKHIELVIETAALGVSADENRLVQVVVNLLSNAIKFSPSKTKITLSAKAVSGFVEVSVADQGRGIPAEFAESIFERFRQIKESDANESHGSGLGLAICKALVELHGGTIRVLSEVDKGSTFYFTVPKAELSESIAVESRVLKS